MSDDPKELRGFDTVPDPSSPEQAELATKLGMILLTGMQDIRNVEIFSALPGAFRTEIHDANGAAWFVQMVRAA